MKRDEWAGMKEIDFKTYVISCDTCGKSWEVKVLTEMEGIPCIFCDEGTLMAVQKELKED